MGKSGRADVAVRELEGLTGRGSRPRVAGVDTLVVLVDPLDRATTGSPARDDAETLAPGDVDVTLEDVPTSERRKVSVSRSQSAASTCSHGTRRVSPATTT